LATIEFFVLIGFFRLTQQTGETQETSVVCIA